MTEKSSRSEQVLALAGASPGIKTSQAAKILGMSTANISQYAGKLRDEGKLKRTHGTLELTDGSSTAEHVVAPADHEPKKSEKSKSPRISDEDLERLRPIIRAASSRAERYRQEGVLTNILVVRKADGEILVRGMMGSGALLCVMIGQPTREALDNPDFQSGMAHLIDSLGDGSGQDAVFYNLTDVGGGDDDQVALVCAWFGGRRVMCTQSLIGDSPLTSGATWKDLSDKQAGKIYEAGIERAKLEESEDEMSGTTVRDLEPSDGSRGIRALSTIMKDPERAPVINVSARFRDGEMEIGMSMMRPELISALAEATSSEEFASDLDQLAPADEADGPADQDPDPETLFIGELINQACARVEDERLSGSLANFIVLGLEDGSTTAVGVGGGEILPMMTGVAGDQMDSLISSISQGGGRLAVFVCMMDLAADGIDLVLLSAWSSGNKMRAALSAPIGDQPLDNPLAGWGVLSAGDLREIGNHDMKLQVAREDDN
jgi:hypothetical protein